MSILQHNIKFIREYLKMTQERLGKDVGATPDQIGTYENRGTRPKSPILNNLVKVFGIRKDILESVELDSKLYEKYFDESLIDIPQGDVPLLKEEADNHLNTLKDDGDKEFKTKSKNSKTDRDLAIQALADIAESNKNNSVGVMNTSEAIKIMAKTNEELVIMLKSKMFTTDFEKNTMEATVATVAGLREYMIEIAASVKQQTREAAEQEFYKKVGEQMDKT